VTTWTIGEAAEKCGLSQHTLRWYERVGLLARIERGGDGRRRFSDADLDWLSLLAKLRATGMPVREMRRYAELVRSGAGGPPGSCRSAGVPEAAGCEDHLLRQLCS
jgi:DNA-binding transcriptional MerR regulator